MLNSAIRRLFSHPSTHDVDLDAPENTLRRAGVIQRKPFLKQFYQDCYSSMSKLLPGKINGPVIELGSGGGFLEEYISDLITSEILAIPTVDIQFDGQHMPFKYASVRALVMLDVFHHIPDPAAFLAQAAHILKPGGCLIMIEPWVTPWSRFVYQYLHHEPFEPAANKWRLQKGGPLTNANSALPWIVFDRDRRKFEDRFPEWQVKKISLHTPFCYLLSGGFVFKSIMPAACYPLCRRFENWLQPFNQLLAMFATIVVQRK
ncbi:MAG: methyltransferase domain-containing protein [Desulfobacterales bacterium]|jgi:SAM-dependent methyltransferase